MKVLIIHHLESTWESGYQDNGESFRSLAAKTIAQIKECEYDRVILTQFGNWRPAQEHTEYIFLPDFIEHDIDEEDEDSGWERLSDHVNQWEQYGYGYDVSLYTKHISVTRGEKSDDWAGWALLGRGKDWDWGGYHSEVIDLPQWLHDLQGNDVHLCGAFDGECIEDMEYALNSLEIDFKRINSLIV